MENAKYCLIAAIVNKGYVNVAMNAARKEGAKGGTYIHARGTSSLETDKFLGLNIEPEKEIILIIAEKDSKKNIMKAINEDVGLNQEGRGIIFSLPVSHVLGSFFNHKDKDTINR